MLSFGMEYERAFSIAFCSARLPDGSRPPSLRRDDDRARQLREELAALRVGGALLVLDRRPLAMPGHSSPPVPWFRNSSWIRVSSVSSGWNAATRMRPSRASTGWPSTSARTSTPGPASSIHGARMKTARTRLVAVADVDVGLEALHLAAERVPLDRDVGEGEVVAVEHDHPRARAEDRRVERAQRLVEPVEAHQPRDRRRLAAGQDQAVEPVELRRQPHLDRLGAEAPQHRRVLAEVALHGKDADSKRLLHGRDCRGR